MRKKEQSFMTAEVLIFIVLIATTLINEGVQLYIHYEAYPLLAFIGKSEFATYIAEYERRLTVPLLVPYVLCVLSNVAFIFVHPDGMSVVLIIIALLLNVAVAGTTIMVVTPVYNAIKQAGQITPAEMSNLMRLNLPRLILSTLSALVVLFLIYDILIV